MKHFYNVSTLNSKTEECLLNEIADIEVDEILKHIRVTILKKQLYKVNAINIGNCYNKLNVYIKLDSDYDSPLNQLTQSKLTEFLESNGYTVSLVRSKYSTIITLEVSWD